MPNYKEMYLTMAREAEKAIRLLVKAQQRCEELYIHSPEPVIVPIERENPPEQE